MVGFVGIIDDEDALVWCRLKTWWLINGTTEILKRSIWLLAGFQESCASVEYREMWPLCSGFRCWYQAVSGAIMQQSEENIQVRAKASVTGRLVGRLTDWID